MTRLALLLAFLFLPAHPALAQDVDPPDGTTISSAQVSGIDLDRLSPGLRDDITKLTGTALDRQRLRDLAARIEKEHPRYVAGVRAAGNADGTARVVFVVARLRDDERQGNVNGRYVVEAVDVSGIAESQLSQSLRDTLHAMVGKPLDSDEADRLTSQLEGAMSKYDVVRRTVRGTEPGRIKVVYEFRWSESARWLRFEPLDANAVYHSDQGWGANLAIGFGDHDVRVTPILPLDNGDDLVEEYTGFGLRFETRKLGTNRAGLFFEWSTYDQDWRSVTLAALALRPDLPAPYRNRMNVTPLLKFAFTPQVSIGGGVAITELDSLLEPGPSRMANAAIGQVRFNERWRRSGDNFHWLDASATLHAGTRSLQSDLVYERYLGEASYVFGSDPHRVRATGSAGRIDGAAPLFERFTLGDSRTLRGWDKYDIAPVGGDRVFSASIEYTFHGLGAFLDSGSVWDHGGAQRVRFSTGLTYSPGPVFFTVGFPLNTDRFRAVFTMGIRFSSITASKP